MDKHSDETFMLYFEVDDVQFNDDKLQEINYSPVTIKVRFLDYPPFNLEQEESVQCTKQLLRFKPHQSFNLKLPSLESPELRFNFYSVDETTCALEHVFYVHVNFNERQRKNLFNLINNCYENLPSFTINEKYKLINLNGELSGFMTVRLRFLRGEEYPRGYCESDPKFKKKIVNMSLKKYAIDEPKSLKSSDCLQGKLSNNIGFEKLSTAEKLNDPEFRELIYRAYQDEDVCDCISGDMLVCPAKKNPCLASNFNIKSMCNKENENSCVEYMQNQCSLKVITPKDLLDKKTDYEKLGSLEEIFVHHANSPLNFVNQIKESLNLKEKLAERTTRASKESKSKDSKNPQTKKTGTPDLKPNKVTLNAEPSETKVASESVTKFQTTIRSKSKRLPKKKHKLKHINRIEADHPHTAKRSMKKFVYNFGDFYPGFGRAHVFCVDQDTKVPAKMGWMWNRKDEFGRLKHRSGWRPGALSMSIRQIMREAKSSFMESHRIRKRPKSAPSRAKRKIIPTRSLTSTGKTAKRKAPVSNKQTEEEQPEVTLPPTLRVLRKDGKYHITMYPVEKEEKVSRLELPPKPIEFTIEKDKDDASSTASDMEIEYSVPVAVSRYQKKPDVVHVDTQVKQAEILNAFKPEVEMDKGKKKAKKKPKKGKK